MKEISSQDTKESLKREFDKRNKKMTKDIEILKETVEMAENEGPNTIERKSFSSATTMWHEVAELAKDLEDQQEWFDSHTTITN